MMIIRDIEKNKEEFQREKGKWDDDMCFMAVAG